MKDFADFEMEIQNQRVLVDTIPNELFRQVILQPIPDKGEGGTAQFITYARFFLFIALKRMSAF